MLNPEQFAAELAGLTDKLSFIDKRRYKPQPLGPADWQRYFGDLSPRQLSERMSDILGNRATFQVIKDSSLTDSITLKCYFDPTPMGGNGITFELQKNGTVHLREVDFAPANQSQGRAKRVLGGCVELFREIGYSKAELDAKDIGSYAWLKFGFRPKFVRGISEDLKKAYNPEEKRIYGCTLTEDEAAVLTYFFEHPTPENFAALADMNRPLPDFKCQATNTGTNITVGKNILIGIDWSGELALDASDPLYQHFLAYTGMCKPSQERAVS